MEKVDTSLLSEHSAEIGAKLRSRRRVRGLSLKEVAERSSLSIGMVSQVERGNVSPSIRSLRAICDALEMPVIWLFQSHDEMQADDSDIVVRSNARRELIYDNGTLKKEILTPDSQPQIQMLRFILESGADSGEPYCNAEGGKCGLVASGVLGLQIDGRTFTINTGDSFAFPAQSMVRFWSIGEATCEVIWVVSPATV
jgi:transcriptional regulator with XRE-family HTH domain